MPTEPAPERTERRRQISEAFLKAAKLKIRADSEPESERARTIDETVKLIHGALVKLMFNLRCASGTEVVGEYRDAEVTGGDELFAVKSYSPFGAWEK